ncbi:MAG: glycerate kinase [Actinomycetota bacterium]|nr:glycerate kinase [Actinomycetota bacterium]
MKVVVAPNAFKGSLSAVEAADAIALGVKAGGGSALAVPVADGGDGTLDALVAAAGGTIMGVICRGPMGIPVRAHLGRLTDGTGVVEMAQASGLTLVPERERDPLKATSFGTGELIKGALARRPHHIVVGVGGSATVDGGMGIARALGVRFFDGAGRELDHGGGALEKLARIDASRLDARLGGVKLVVASDVDVPLCGPEGAAYVFGPQKGAGPKQVEQLDRGLAKLAERLAEDLDADVAARPGAGAAGGAGAMLMALGADLRRGIDVVLEAAGFGAKLDGAALVITGEGRIDETTLAGKAPAGVARAATDAGVPCAALAGESDLADPAPFVEIRTLLQLYEGDRRRAMEAAAQGLTALAKSLTRDRAE